MGELCSTVPGIACKCAFKEDCPDGKTCAETNGAPFGAYPGSNFCIPDGACTDDQQGACHKSGYKGYYEHDHPCRENLSKANCEADINECRWYPYKGEPHQNGCM